MFKTLADVFDNFWNMCLKIHELDHARALKNTKVKLDLLTNIDVLLMVEKGIRDGICHAIHRYAKANNKYTNDSDKKKKSYLLRQCPSIQIIYVPIFKI